LAKDLGELAKLRGKVEEQFFRRLAFRNVLPVFEAFLSNLRSRAIEAHGHGKVVPTAKAMEELEEETPRLKGMLREAVRCHAETRGATTLPGSTLRIPPQLDSCVSVRNRLIHPKRILYMEASNDEVASLVAMLAWFEHLSDWASAAEPQSIGQIRKEVNQSFESVQARVGREPEGAV